MVERAPTPPGPCRLWTVRVRAGQWTGGWLGLRLVVRQTGGRQVGM